MKTLNNRTIDDHGLVALTIEGAMEMLYQGNTDFSDFSIEDCEEASIYNTLEREESGLDRDPDEIEIYKPLDVSVEEFDEKMQSIWVTPEPYASLDIPSYLLNLCSNSKERLRVNDELKLFEERKMIPVLKALVWLVAVMREHKIVWGVGRGSSCSSFCLYLIGVHKVNSLKYNLNIRDFLK